ncbi:MAG: hypothetical protein HOH47_07375 [Flavobacteriaceae bacterium]|nr:hypothetical protein [Flavobacteriaceae bacterium]
MSISLSGQHFSKRKIRRMLQKIPAFEQAHIALSVEALNTSKPKAFYQGGNYMTPASNVKLLTFLAAIQNFDSLPALYYKKKDSIMHFKATGYPLLFHPFYPDPELASFFDQKYYWKYYAPKSTLNAHGHGWSWDDYSYYYAAENSPFPIYGNTTQVFLTSNSNRMNPASLEKQMVLDTLGQNLHRKRSKNRFYLNPQSLEERDTLYHPFITSDSLFVEILNDHTKLPIQLVKDSISNWNLMYSRQEKLLYKGLLQDSDNGVAEALVNMVSQKTFNEMNVQKTIDTLKLQWEPWLPDPIEWVDGSGVSRYNMVTPRTLIAVLKKIHREIGLESIKEYFPKSGRSGTLKDYAISNVYAKTGTLRHNHNLSGYWISDRGNVYVFSIMANHFTTPTDQIRQGISELLRQFQKKLK